MRHLIHPTESKPVSSGVKTSSGTNKFFQIQALGIFF